MVVTASDRLRRTIQLVWIAGFLARATTHVAELVAGGADTYVEFPGPARAFWISLTALDPLTALLILLRRRSGIVLGLAVILSDIIVNWTILLTIGGHSLFGVVSQSLFAAFLLVTAPALWRWLLPHRRGATSGERPSAPPRSEAPQP